MRIAKTRKVHTPHRGTELSAGIDLFVPEFDDNFNKDFIKMNEKTINEERLILNKTSFILAPNSSVMIPTGIFVDLSSNNKGKVKLTATNRGSIASKKQLIVGACLIDADYQGEIFINLINTSTKLVKIQEHEKIVQLVLNHVIYEDIEVVPKEYLYNHKSKRNLGCLGSTN